ncbi:MAG: TetR family transcriptional regulator [Desulfohalobiaceae bacterium]|nr:TetR family transcriptional regulator [Desulfohalobiaceae bacterium]
MNQTKKRAKYEQILEAAIRVFARQGYHNSTISQVAREAGVGDGTIYLYFKNKDDILDNFFSYKTTQIFSQFKEEVDTCHNALEKLERLVASHLTEFEQNRDLAVVYEVETRMRRHLSDEKIKEMSRMYFDLVAEIVEQGRQEGTIRQNIPVHLVKQYLIGAVDEVITTWLYSSKDYRLVSQAEPLVDLFINGIGTNGASAVEP